MTCRDLPYYEGMRAKTHCEIKFMKISTKSFTMWKKKLAAVNLANQ